MLHCSFQAFSVCPRLLHIQCQSTYFLGCGEKNMRILDSCHQSWGSFVCAEQIKRKITFFLNLIFFLLQCALILFVFIQAISGEESKDNRNKKDVSDVAAVPSTGKQYYSSDIDIRQIRWDLFGIRCKNIKKQIPWSRMNYVLPVK